MKVIYEDANNELKAIDLFYHVKERTFEQFCDFKNKEVEFWRVARSENPSEEVDPREALRRALVEIIPGNYDLPYNSNGERLIDLQENGYLVNPGDELTLIRLYAHALNVINSFVPDKIPETFKFKHKGKSFEIESKPAARMLTGMAFTAGEAIEVLEYMKRAQEALKKNPSQEGNIDFALGLTEIAILVRQKGERLPAERPRLEKFIALRREFFKSLSLDVVLSMRFFFLNILLSLGTIPTSGPFGKMFLATFAGVAKQKPSGSNIKKLSKQAK